MRGKGPANHHHHHYLYVSTGEFFSLSLSLFFVQHPPAVFIHNLARRETVSLSLFHPPSPLGMPKSVPIFRSVPTTGQTIVLGVDNLSNNKTTSTED